MLACTGGSLQKLDRLKKSTGTMTGWAALAEPENREAQQCAIDIFQARADAEISLMWRWIFSHAVRKAEEAIAAMDDNA